MTQSEPDELLFVGTRGYLAAFDKRTGEEAWRVDLKGTGYNLVTVLVEDGVLFAGTYGYLFALDPRNGEVLWRNDMKGLGHGMVSMATTHSRPSAHDNPTLQAQRQAEMQAAAASTNT